VKPPPLWPPPPEAWLGLVVLLIAALIYLLPGIIAFRRHHHNAVAILVFDLLLGWTFLGWVLALVWALTEVRRREDRQRIEPDFL